MLSSLSLLSGHTRILAVAIAFLLSRGVSKGDLYTQSLSMADPFLLTPFESNNAIVYEETFAPNVRYWGPVSPNLEGFVTLKFDVPFSIERASLAAGITAYTAGSDANFDSSAATYLEVSTDNATWMQVASQTNQNACCSGVSGPWDLTPFVAGANTVYVRSRMFMSTNFSFSPSQFMRQGAPYDPGYLLAVGGSSALTQLVSLDFETPVASGINDVNGLGTGFTHWLPGTGGAIPRNDPNLDLLGSPGFLEFSSTRSDINQFNGFGRNLPQLDAPGVLLTEMLGRDFRVEAEFHDIEVAGLSDQLLLYVGVSAGEVIRGGFHENGVPSTGQYVLAGNIGSGDFGFPSIDQLGDFQAGDNIRLALARVGGVWSMEWENLTRPLDSGSVTGVSVPWLADDATFYVGLMHMDARNLSSQVAKVASFRVLVGDPIPEPPALIASGLLGITVAFARRRYSQGGIGR